MNDIVDFHQSQECSFNVGDVCLYKEGVVTVKVKVLNKNQEGNMLSYTLEPLEVLRPWFLIGNMKKSFDVGKRLDIHGYSCWLLTRFKE